MCDRCMVEDAARAAAPHGGVQQEARSQRIAPEVEAAQAQEHRGAV